jgi:hypothetical protein
MSINRAATAASGGWAPETPGDAVEEKTGTHHRAEA